MGDYLFWVLCLINRSRKKHSIFFQLKLSVGNAFRGFFFCCVVRECYVAPSLRNAIKNQ